MGDIVPLHNLIDVSSDAGRAFVVDATRAAEGVISDQELQERYELSPAELKTIAADKAVGRAIRDERARRVRNGTAARELAAKAFVRAPAVLDQIMTHADSPRHRIDAARELRATAAGSDGDGPSQTEKFTIIINLGADHIERHEVDVTPKAKQLDLEGKPDGNEWG